MKSKKMITALVVGAGAVENAWAPVLRALQSYHDFPLTADGANAFLARAVYLLRWWASDNSDRGRNELEKLMALLAQMRNAICAELVLAQKANEIRVRREFASIVDAMLIQHNTEFMLVTTNWDDVVGNALSSYLNRTVDCKVLPLHIHGSIRDAHTLYLPTEVTKEPYRSREEEKAIGGLHGSIWRGLERAHRVVIYGLSLSPLDAELGQTLACGFSNNNLKEVCIVAPDHEQIAHKVNLLLDRKREIAIKGYEPCNLGKAHDYTVRRR